MMARSLRRVALLLFALPLAAGAASEDAPVPRASPETTIAPDRRNVERLPPTIERVMPFSSCNPGGAVLLQGKNFGTRPGRLRLVGRFPKGPIELEKLEWGSTSVGGQVPMVEGVLDQPVKIQVVTSDGEFSNGVHCDFRATRVEVALAGSEDYSKGFCDLGDNYWSGNDFYDGDQHYQAGAPTGATIICYHKSDKPTTHGDNEGTDVWTLRQLENDWKLTRMPFADYSAGSGELLARRGFAAGATGGELTFHWRMGHDAVVHYSFLVFAEGPAGVPMHERVELPSRAPEEMGDFVPQAPRGHVPLTIVSPASSIQAGASSFELAITAGALQPDWTIELEWAHLANPKDASLGRESWEVGKPSSAPTLVAWSALPLTLRTTGQFDAQNYAVRARVQGQGDDTWTDWKRFHLVPRAKLEKAPDEPKTAALRVPGGKPAAERVAAPKAMKTMNTVREAGLAALPQPQIELDARAAKPSPKPTAKDRFGVTGLRVRNSGKADAAAGHVPLTLRCVPLDGGSCRVHAGFASLPAVPAGQTRPLPLGGVFEASAKGRYRIQVTLGAPDATRENTWNQEVTVADPPRLNQIPRPQPGRR